MFISLLLFDLINELNSEDSFKKLSFNQNPAILELIYTYFHFFYDKFINCAISLSNKYTHTRTDENKNLNYYNKMSLFS